MAFRFLYGPLLGYIVFNILLCPLHFYLLILSCSGQTAAWIYYLMNMFGAPLFGVFIISLCAKALDVYMFSNKHDYLSSKAAIISSVANSIICCVWFNVFVDHLFMFRHVPLLEATFYTLCIGIAPFIYFWCCFALGRSFAGK